MEIFNHFKNISQTFIFLVLPQKDEKKEVLPVSEDSSSESEEEEEGEEENSQIPDEELVTSPESSSESEEEIAVRDAKLKRKRKQVSQNKETKKQKLEKNLKEKKEKKKPKKSPKAPAKPVEKPAPSTSNEKSEGEKTTPIMNENQHGEISDTTKPIMVENQHGEISDTSNSKKPKKESPIFNDKKIDLNLFDNDPENVVEKRIILNKSTILMCKNTEASTAGNAPNFDFAALVFQKKTKDSRAFEFTLPMSLTGRLIEGLQYIVKENPKFFKAKIV